jgi:hypothetical protein
MRDPPAHVRCSEPDVLANEGRAAHAKLALHNPQLILEPAAGRLRARFFWGGGGGMT